MVASGLAMPLPAISGAEPWLGSYRPWPPAFRDADGSMPIEPVMLTVWNAMKDGLSRLREEEPKRLLHTMEEFLLTQSEERLVNGNTK
ncbi:hypothetical protein D3C73_1052880 [compost metagenome]